MLQPAEDYVVADAHGKTDHDPSEGGPERVDHDARDLRPEVLGLVTGDNVVEDLQGRGERDEDR